MGGKTPALVRQHQGDEIYTLVDYRNRYAQYKMDPDLKAAHASAPFIVTWDDHEVDNDYAGDRDENDTPPEVFLLRRAAAYQAFFETMPLRASTIPSGPNMRLYRRLQFGNLLDLSVLDTRQFRSKQACGVTTRHRLRGGARSGADDSRLGAGAMAVRAARDRESDVDRARAAGADLRARQQGAAPNGRYSMDKWDGYVASRQRLYARLKETKAPNPIVLSGDVHVHYGADLKLDFENPRSETVGVEFTNTSVTSGADGADVSATWERMRGDNPHIKYHSARRGYIACTATPTTMRADFKILDRVTVPDAAGAHRRRRSSSRPAARGRRWGRASTAPFTCHGSQEIRRPGVPRVWGFHSTFCALDLLTSCSKDRERRWVALPAGSVVDLRDRLGGAPFSPGATT